MDMKFRFRHPCTGILAGQTGCGKSYWIKKLIQNKETMFEPPPEIVHFCYSEFQPAYFEMQSWPNVVMYQGMPDLDVFRNGSTKRQLVILDDLMTTAKSDKLNDLYTKISHHHNISCLHIVQNLFFPGLRTARINSHYLILFRNPSDKLCIETLARQLYPRNKNFLTEVYQNATMLPYTYLVLDLHQLTDERCRVRANVFPDEAQCVYVEK
jgi:hypothetical protein